jgi:cold shock CspA family protein
VNRRLEGIIIDFFLDRGYGFVSSGDTRYFVHVTQLPGNLDREELVGKLVSFLPGETAKGPAAYRVRVLEEGEEG